MAAFEDFQSVVDRLSVRERELLRDLIQQCREDLLAARSEEARVRVVEEFVTEAHDRSKPVKR